MNTSHTLSFARSVHPDTNKHTHAHTLIDTCCHHLSTSIVHLCLFTVCLSFTLPPLLLCYCKRKKHNIHYYIPLSIYIIFLSLVRGSNCFRLKNKQSMSFLVPSEFTCDCSKIWSKPIFSRLPPPPPPPPCSLKVTPGDFGRGTLKLLCQCETLQ